MVRSILFLLLFCITPIHAADTQPPIRFGLTAVVVTENLRFLDQWSEYLGQKMDRKVELERRWKLASKTSSTGISSFITRDPALYRQKTLSAISN